MSERGPNRAILKFADAARLTRCCIADELLERLIRSEVPAFVRVPDYLMTFAHLEEAQQPWRKRIASSAVKVRLDTFDYGALNRPPVARNTQIFGDRFARLDNGDLERLLLAGSVRCNRFGAMIVLSSGHLRKVLPRDSFSAIGPAELLCRRIFFVTVVCDDASTDLNETWFEVSQGDLWIERSELPKLSAAEASRQFGEVLLGQWASVRLMELNEASDVLFSKNDSSAPKELKKAVEQWFEAKWGSMQSTIRGHARSLITPDKLLREHKSLQRKIPNPVFTIPRNDYTSTRLALMNEVALAAFEEGQLHNRPRIVQLLEERGIKGAIGSSAASIIAMSDQEVTV